VSKVLVAEDEEALLDVMCEVVSGLGHEVLRAADGEDALTIARAQRPDLVITDHMMPRRSGVELIRALTADADLAAVPVVMISAVRPRGLEAAWRFMSKPVPLAALEDVITEALGVGAKHEVAPSAGQSSPSTARVVEETLHWAAHELKTPISSAQLAAELLQKRLGADGADPRDRDAVALILRQLSRMSVFVGAVLDAAQLREGRVSLEREALELTAWLDEVSRDWRAVHPDVHLSVSTPGEPVTVQADPRKLRVVLDNLLGNAVKHGAPSRRVEVSLDLAPGLVNVHVTDHGLGIPAAELPRLFDRFHRAAGTANGGHGLGLYIAASLARLHGGCLSARSELGHGATFTLSLPRT
jgi:signal transduction histidine kinase